MRPKPQEINLKTSVTDALPKLRYSGPYKKCVDIAEYYGFRLLPTLRVTREDRKDVERIPCPADRVTLLREYLERGMDGFEQPVQLCHTCKVPYQPTLHFRLEAVGSKKSMTEALIMYTAYIILEEHGYKDLTIAINSVGGKESLERYIKELTNYYKKYLGDLDEETRAAFMNDDVFAPLRSKEEAAVELRVRAPKPISFLTEASRAHLAEVLEYLETFEIPYHIQDTLVGSQNCTTRTIFAFHTTVEEKATEENTLAYGERYDHLSKSIGLGRKIPAVGLTIDLGKQPGSESIAPYKQNREEEPVVYVVQVGPDAQRSILRIIEQLRQASIPVATSFAHERLSYQMKNAERLDVPTLVIVGQKEITEGTAIIRNRNTRTQRVVSQTRLPSHLKRMCSMY